MDEERFIKLLVKLYNGLPRLGPGNEQSTLKALALCEHLPNAPDILDIGCGTGAQTLTLASATSGKITATDLIPEFLDQLMKTAREKSLDNHIRIQKADLNKLPFPDNSFDLIWSEGAAYIMGFDNALIRWKHLVKPGGYLVVSEASWFKSDPPSELKMFWDENYPAMRDVKNNLASARKLGWETMANFHLPVEAWTVDYYEPLKQRLPVFREENADDKDAQEVADMTDYEISLIENYSDYYGYEFFVLRRPAKVN